MYPKTFKKVIKGSVGGRLLTMRGSGPYFEEEFLLRGDPATAATEDITVIILDEECEKYFRRYNKAALNRGYLIEEQEDNSPVNNVNSVSDGFLKDLLKLPITKMKSEVAKFTSPIPVNRLLAIAKAENKPVKTIEYLTSMLAGFSESGMPNSATIDGAAVGKVN